MQAQPFIFLLIGPVLHKLECKISPRFRLTRLDMKIPWFISVELLKDACNVQITYDWRDPRATRIVVAQTDRVSESMKQTIMIYI